MRGFVCATFAVLTAAVCVCWSAAPEPAIVPRPGQWTVNTKFTHPRQILLRSGPENKAKRFWYLLITITNNTGRDVDFYPKCDLMTNTFEIIPAGKSVTPGVFQNIKKRYQSTYPFLESLQKAGHKILQGEDNTKDIVVIWPDFDTKATGIKLFITGLSNETASVDHPIVKDKDGNPAKIYLRKTLELTYALEGEAALRADTNLVYKAKRWIMR